MLMRERVLDDWYYQSNARRLITDELEKAKKTEFKYTLNDMMPKVRKQAFDIMNRLAANYDITAGTKFDIVKLKQEKSKLRSKSRSAKGLLPDVPVYSK